MVRNKLMLFTSVFLVTRDLNLMKIWSKIYCEISTRFLLFLALCRDLLRQSGQWRDRCSFWLGRQTYSSWVVLTQSDVRSDDDGHTRHHSWSQTTAAAYQQDQIHLHAGVTDLTCNRGLLMGSIIRGFQYIRDLYHGLDMGPEWKQMLWFHPGPITGHVAFKRITATVVALAPTINTGIIQSPTVIEISAAEIKWTTSPLGQDLWHSFTAAPKCKEARV